MKDNVIIEFTCVGVDKIEQQLKKVQREIEKLNSMHIEISVVDSSSDNNFFKYLFGFLLALIALFLISGCNPPQSTPVKAEVKSDTTIKYHDPHDDTAVMWKRLINTYGLDQNNDFGQGVMEITIHDTIQKDCPQQVFPKLRRLRGNLINNSPIAPGTNITGNSKGGATGDNSPVKPQTNNGYSPKQLLLPALAGSAFLLVVGIVIGFLIGKRK